MTWAEQYKIYHRYNTLSVRNSHHVGFFNGRSAGNRQQSQPSRLLELMKFHLSFHMKSNHLLINICNTWLRCKHIPKCFKSLQIIIIAKKSDELVKQVALYETIALLLVICKLFEKLQPKKDFNHSSAKQISNLDLGITTQKYQVQIVTSSI